MLKKVGRKPQLMEWDLYRKIIDDLAAMPEPIKTLRLYKDGEPLLNLRLPNMISYAKLTGRFLSIDTTTNGLLLNDFMMTPTLIAAGLDKIFISVPLKYTSKYIKGVQKIYKYGRGRCHVLVKIIGDNLTEDQKEQFMDDFGDISDSIFIEHTAPCWSGYEVKGVNKKVGIYGQKIVEIETCSYIHYSLAINSDGTVSICFLDYKHQNIIGDLRQESFKSIWNGSRLRAFQIDMLTDRTQIPFCNECKQLSYGAADNIDLFRKELLEKLR